MEEEEQRKQVKQVIQEQDRSMIPQISEFDYKKCRFECRIYKKRIISSQLKYCYINDDYLAICDEAYKQYPDKIIGLTHDIKVQWVYNKAEQPYKLTGFIFKQTGDDVEYLAEEDVLQSLKQVFRKKIFQSRFQDEYEVLSQVGKGNYARVFSIKHRVTGQKFAVKCFEKSKLEKLEKGILSLYNELKIMRTLGDHPNIIKLHETFEGENTFYFVMEIVEGASLYDEIKRLSQKTKTDEEEVYSIIKMIVDAVAHCAKHNIMHRDLKPENILFAKRGSFSQLKIVDFGLATLQDQAPYLFPKCGTPGFVAPEIANLTDKQKPYDIICDMFSVGVIFHILLTGETVFPGNKFNEVLKKNKECNIKLTGSAYEFVSLEAKDLLQKMLAKDPKDRITAQQAQSHPYFQKKKKQAKVFDDIGLQYQKKDDDLPDQIRPKKQSLFGRTPRIPYLKKEDAVDPKYEDINSFVIKEPLWAGEKQNEMKQSPQIPQMPDSLYYTIGSLDQTNKINVEKSQQQSQQQQQEAKVPIAKKNAQNTNDKNKEAIKEEDVEEEEKN